MSSNIADILKQLDTISAENGIDVYLPSQKRSVKFRPLNLKQQKSLLSSSIDESLTKLSFNSTFYNIIKENILDTVNPDLLLTIDRSAIALTLRSNSLDSKITVNDKQIDLNKVITNIPLVPLDTYPLNAIADDGTVVVKLSAPTLGSDNELNKFALSKQGQNTDFKTVIGELFVYELTKFIQSVTIKGTESDTVIDFYSLKTADKIAIAEKLTSTATNKILDFIKSYRALEALYTKVDDESIDIDGSFFTV